jgi:hypothetical protein
LRGPGKNCKDGPELILGAIQISQRSTRLRVAEIGEESSSRLLDRSSRVSAELRNAERLTALLMAEIEAARDAGAVRVEVIATRSLRGSRLLRLLDRVSRAAGAGGILLPGPAEALASTFLSVTKPIASELPGSTGVARIAESTTGVAIGIAGDRPGWIGSRPLGAASLTERARFSDPPRPNQIEAAINGAVRRFGSLSPPVCDRLFVSSPHSTVLERLCGPRMDVASARRGLDLILGQTGDDIAAWFGADSGQAKLLPATIVCCLALCEVFENQVEPRYGDLVAGRAWLDAAARGTAGAKREA